VRHGAGMGSVRRTATGGERREPSCCCGLGDLVRSRVEVGQQQAG
jgi:hypothetical protein